jgi:hypothetical protein
MAYILVVRLARVNLHKSFKKLPWEFWYSNSNQIEIRWSTNNELSQSAPSKPVMRANRV